MKSTNKFEKDPVKNFIAFMGHEACEEMPLVLAWIVLLCCFVDALYFLYLN